MATTEKATPPAYVFPTRAKVEAGIKALALAAVVEAESNLVAAVAANAAAQAAVTSVAAHGSEFWFVQKMQLMADETEAVELAARSAHADALANAS